MAAALLLALASWLSVADTIDGAPFYTADSIANSAASVTNLYAPNTYLTIYGQNLSYNTAFLSADQVNTVLPTALIGTGVVVLVNNIPAYLFYVSPTQVNLLVPSNLVAGPAKIQLELNGHAGPPV